jgi:hypothetical protein
VANLSSGAIAAADTCTSLSTPNSIRCLSLNNGNIMSYDDAIRKKELVNGKAAWKQARGWPRTWITDCATQPRVVDMDA